MAQIRTKEGATRRYESRLRQYMRDFAGGGSFGFDWPTMRLNAPGTYAELRQILDIFPTLPSRRKA